MVPSFCLSPAYRRAIKEVSKAVNLDWINNQACRLSKKKHSVQEITEYKFHELCLLRRSVEARPNALFPIFSNFSKLKKIFVNFFFLKWRNESDVLANIKKFCRI